MEAARNRGSNMPNTALPDSDVASSENESAEAKSNSPEEEAAHGPLTSDEFRSVLEQTDALGLTWSADIPPRIKPKNGEKRDILLSEEYAKIQQKYPSFPRELGLVMFHAL